MCCILIHYYMVMSPVSTADRIKFMLGEEDDGPPPPQLFTELDELLSVDGQEMEWKETARLETLLFFSLFFFDSFRQVVLHPIFSAASATQSTREQSHKCVKGNRRCCSELPVLSKISER